MDSSVVDFLVVDFLVVDFLVVDFLVVDFLVVDFLVVDFLVVEKVAMTVLRGFLCRSFVQLTNPSTRFPRPQEFPAKPSRRTVKLRYHRSAKTLPRQTSPAAPA